MTGVDGVFYWALTVRLDGDLSFGRLHRSALLTMVSVGVVSIVFRLWVGRGFVCGSLR